MLYVSCAHQDWQQKDDACRKRFVWNKREAWNKEGPTLVLVLMARKGPVDFSCLVLTDFPANLWNRLSCCCSWSCASHLHKSDDSWCRFTTFAFQTFHCRRITNKTRWDDWNQAKKTFYQTNTYWPTVLRTTRGDLTSPLLLWKEQNLSELDWLEYQAVNTFIHRSTV